MKRLAVRVVALTLICITTATGSTESLVLGIHPYRSHAELRAMFTPLAEYLSLSFGKPVEVRIGESYESHFDAIINDQVDLAFIGPALFVQLSDKYGVPNLLARLEIDGIPTFTGKIFTKEGSSIRTLEDLKGSHFAFGSKSSTMSHLVPRQLLFEAGIDVDDFASHRYFHSHDNVALAVLAGDADAGAVKEAVFRKYQHRGLVAVATTPDISEHLFIAPSGIDHDRVELLRRHLLHLTAGNPETGQVLRPIKKTATALVSVEASDYKKLRDIFTALRARGVVE
ncbi:MAG: phosphate/phosphite/phosphonate ABC transporter substrate-binding protein [Candidatus Thiodiazotropha sp. (ex Ctena orbiculata)]|uniref:Phosphate/phosphite/phosphonate ABC transporter substrate-binding protein n=1 Tax=Candidatus Thiodiazotropha taylori TaxID=2792791 RepID=A0A944QU09_9GAMM|nr:phosphate/phosphite/phosphonate ABC transporter substrate-binding protein [Candidatus Thiodiazotropha taylori]MBT2988156.1 phosphate/phosphite/phosphonate ABC transporter substrate-binding protein [Candidatus Thiodiazotropha taylori]MBT2998520.1 phosphate/phosphite/phosphonate ABC transporter substrate-binding protein [Candidatus Thiodiazotropha taylori]MBT3002102.1 phosphate/phosphite/phosphonate ABC transporter substrate-binding protein [Candidatus Thiodiazotropha taylori]MBT3026477.1 phos